MFVVESFEMIIIVKFFSFKQYYKKFGTFSITNGYVSNRIQRFIFNIFTERDGLNSYF